jgi:hypothetical protein
VGTPLVSLLALRAPLAAAGLLGAFGVGVAAATSPTAFVAGAAFLSAAVPKAGLLFGGLPLPVMMALLLLAALMLRQHAEPVPRPGQRVGVMALAWLLFRALTLRADGGSIADVAALAGWYGLPILLLVAGPAVGSLRGDGAERWTRWLELGVLGACAFSALQQVAGIERTAVPGVTRAVGADYSRKPLAFAGGSKIPSTYQNGNVLGVVTAVFFLVAADRVLRGRGAWRDAVIMVATAAATILSGSRTVLVGLVLGLGVLILRSGLRRQTIATCVLCVVVAGVVLHFSPALSARLAGTTASDPALAQRSQVWTRVLHSTSVRDALIGGRAWAHPLDPPGLAEGAIGAVQQVGLVGLALFVGAIIGATSPPHLRRWRIILIPVAVSLAVDSAYLVFPTVFLPLARMFAPLEIPEPGLRA